MTEPTVRAGARGVRLVCADITTLRADAIVNAANQNLAGGGGVDGAIHRAAGAAALQRELRERHPDGCPTGGAVITGAHRLTEQGVRHIVHAVGPRWNAAQAERCDGELASAYRSALGLAAEAGAASVALPSISTGIYGFPVDRAAPIALEAAMTAIEAPGTALAEVTFALFSEEDLRVFATALDRPPARSPG